jgi:REP element-mobilizing transposase RayT
MWSDTDIPLGYLITFRCYGTWLHGDKRGSVDREHNRYKSPYGVPNRNRRRHNETLLKSEPVLLNASQRGSVEKAITDTCSHRKWRLHACSVRTNHVHSVVSIGSTKPELALNALKANATRQMREDGHWHAAHSPWLDKGSKRYLWTERSLALAIEYVLHGQGDELPEFD